MGGRQEWGIGLSHTQLSRLFVEIQPSHLQSCHAAGTGPEATAGAYTLMRPRKFAKQHDQRIDDHLLRR